MLSEKLMMEGWTASEKQIYRQAQKILEQRERQQRLQKQSASLKKLKEDIETLIKNVSFSRRLVDRMGKCECTVQLLISVPLAQGTKCWWKVFIRHR